MSEQQPDWVRLGYRKYRALCSQAVCSACIFPLFVGAAELLSTGDAAGLHHMSGWCTLLWGEAGAGHIPLQPFLLLPAGCPGLPCLPQPCSCWKEESRGALGSKSCFCWVVAVLAEEPACPLFPICLPPLHGIVQQRIMM